MLLLDNAIQGVHAKQGCYVCGSPNLIVDTEVSIDYEGVLAICRGCAKDVAQAAGWNLEVDAAYVERLESELADAKYERDSAEKCVSELYETIQEASKRHKERQRKLALKGGKRA